MAAMDILIVEDSVEYRQAVAAVARDGGHRVRTAETIADALVELSSVPPDLVVLDLALPDGDGLDLCREIRARSSAYVLMLTARDDEVDKLVGFRLGADDYVTKPFSPRELAARIEALSRRTREPLGDVAERVIGKVTVRSASREAEIDGTPVDLTRIEFELLDLFVSNAKQVFTRAQLLERVWGENWYGDDHVVDVHVANLRKKMAAAGGRSVVRTLRGVGYGLSADPH